MKFNFDLNTDERGVSPVIGVILMVAITVILAAVIGAFVLNLGSNLGQTGPNAQLAASDSSANYGSGDKDMVTLSHKGGESLTASDLKVVITDSDGNTITMDPAHTADADGTQIYAQSNGNSAIDSDSSLSVGGSWYVHGSDSDFDSGETVTVQVIHKPSQSILLDTDVTVN